MCQPEEAGRRVTPRCLWTVHRRRGQGIIPPPHAFPCGVPARADNSRQVPRPYTVGSFFKFSKEASYWAFSMVGNWAERFRMFAHADVAAQQQALETPLFEAQVLAPPPETEEKD